MLTAETQIALVVAAMAMSIPATTFAQTPESATGSVPVEAEVAEVTSGLAGNEDSTNRDTSVQTEQAGAVEVEIQRRINEPQNWLSSLESWSTIIRNFGLLIVAVIALPLAIWRSIVAARQAETAKRGLLNERYQKGAEMLDSGGLSGRIGGIYALAGLAREDPKDYHTKIMRLLCGFVRHPFGDAVEVALPTEGLSPDAKHASGFESYDEDDYDTGGQLREGVEVRPQRVREDVQAVMTAIGERSNEQINAEEGEKYRLDLREADLRYVYLADANLERANLYRANLEGAVIIGSNLDRRTCTKRICTAHLCWGLL